MLSNTLALDVVIGLVLIYFIYSLLISIVGEMLSSWMGIRARLLRQGIASLLNDQQPGEIQDDFASWIKDVFLVEPADFKFSNAGRFYKEPGIRKLAKRGDEKAWYSIRNTKPSYLSKELYANIIIAMFGRKGWGVCERDRVFMGVNTNAIHLEPETYKRFKEMLDASNGELTVFRTHLENEFSEMMDRVTGWYKRKLGLILFWLGFLICMALNVDTFQIVHVLVKNPAVREKMVKLAREAVKDRRDGLTWTQVSVDSSAYITILEDNYAKAFQDAREVEFLMAKGWDFDDEPASIKVDEKDTIAVARLLKLATATQVKIDSVRELIDGLDLNAAELKNAIAEYYSLGRDHQKKVLEPLGKILKKRVSSVKLTDLKTSNVVKVTVEPGLFRKIVIILGHTLPPWKFKFWGIVLSALALSLGSNFWFDLLKRLVAIRSAGVKPEEKTEGKNEAEPDMKKKNEGTYPEINDPVEKAISDNRSTWERIPWIVAINPGVFDIVGTKKRGIEIVVKEGAVVQGTIPDNVDVVLNGITTVVPIACIIGKAGVFAVDFEPKAGHIFHSFTRQYGTPAGIVRNKRTNKPAILTCAHASITTSAAFLVDDEEKVELVVTAKDQKKSEIGKIRNRIFSSYIDAAVIDLDPGFDASNIKVDGVELSNLSKPAPVTSEGQGNLKLVVHTVRGEVKGGVLTHARANHHFKDELKSANFQDLIRFGKAPYKEFLTEPGDSGALITANGIPVAILIGAAETSEGKFSFGVKLTDIMETLQLTII